MKSYEKQNLTSSESNKPKKTLLNTFFCFRIQKFTNKNKDTHRLTHMCVCVHVFETVKHKTHKYRLWRLSSEICHCHVLLKTPSFLYRIFCPRSLSIVFPIFRYTYCCIFNRVSPNIVSLLNKVVSSSSDKQTTTQKKSIYILREKHTSQNQEWIWMKTQFTWCQFRKLNVCVCVFANNDIKKWEKRDENGVWRHTRKVDKPLWWWFFDGSWRYVYDFWIIGLVLDFTLMDLYFCICVHNCETGSRCVISLTQITKIVLYL